MRNEIPKAILALSKNHPLVFMTGDLGFMALEPLQEALGNRFINAGVAEQNMIAVAAGLTLSGQQTWVYSIASFCYARPFEHIRNDICLNKLPVKLIGNGGGYAYGCMAGTHHALEDYGVLLSLQSMQIFVPAFAADVGPIIHKMAMLTLPCYLRLGRCELPKEMTLPTYRSWRFLLDGKGPLLVCMGPLAGSLLHAFCQMDYSIRPAIWVVTELPLILEEIPTEFLQRLSQAKILCVVEEHVAQGGFAQNLLWLLLKNNIALPQFLHAHAKGYPSGTYGSQLFHRIECGLDPQSIIQMLGLNEVNKKYA